MNGHIKYRLLICLLSALAGTSYSITLHFQRFLICSIFFFFWIGFIGSYWFGQPSPRSLILLAQSLKVFALVIVVYAQSDCIFAMFFLLISMGILSLIIYAFSRLRESKNIQSVCKSFNQICFVCMSRLWKRHCEPSTKPMPTSTFCHFPLLTREEFEFQSSETQKFLTTTAEFIRKNPSVIRKFRHKNRAKIALFSLDPTLYEFSESDSNQISLDESIGSEFENILNNND